MSEADDPHATHLQYVGIAGATPDCVAAVERLLLTDADVRSALILTSRKGSRELWTKLLASVSKLPWPRCRQACRASGSGANRS